MIEDFYFEDTTTTTERVLTNLSTGLQKAAISQSSNLIATSLVKGQSFDQTIEQKGGLSSLALNTLTQAVAEAGAKEIGFAYHGGEISKAELPATNQSMSLRIHSLNLPP
jgi:hypothetical protein